MLLDSEKRMENVVVLDFTLSRSGPKRENAFMFTAFFCCMKFLRAEADFQQDGLQICLTQREPKNAFVPLSFTAWAEKCSDCKAPSVQGEDHHPKRTPK